MGEIWIAIIPTIGVPLIWALIIWITSNMKAHENLYWKVAKEADKYKWVNVRASLGESARGNPLGATLVITNFKDITVKDFKIGIQNVMEGATFINQGMYSEREVFIGDPYDMKKYPYVLPVGEPVIYSVAVWHQESARIPERNEDNMPNSLVLKAGILYTVTMKFFGEVEGRRMDDYSRKYTLKLTSDNIEFKELI